MKFLKEWSLLFIICFSSFLKASADQAAEATPQEEVTVVTVVTVDQIWNQIQLINNLPKGNESLHNERLRLVDLYTRFVDPLDPTNVRFNFTDLLEFSNKEALKEYVYEAREVKMDTIAVAAIWNKIELIRYMSKDDKNMSEDDKKSLKTEILELVNLYTGFVDPIGWKNVTFNVGELLAFSNEEDLEEYVYEARRVYTAKREKRRREDALRLEAEAEAEFEGAVMLQTGE